jgi:hypothetical protein
VVDEDDLRRMSRDERRRLARLLASIDEPHVLRDNRARWRRRVALLLTMGSCVVLAAWIAVLMLTLPKHYTAGHWRGAWVGFDFALLLAFGTTAWAAWRERQALIILLTITGTLLCCDAWFDVVLDLGSSDIWLSVASAVLIELPMALLMFSAARRLIRLSALITRPESGGMGDYPDGTLPPLWKIPLFGIRPAATESRSPDGGGRARSG